VREGRSSGKNDAARVRTRVVVEPIGECMFRTGLGVRQPNCGPAGVTEGLAVTGLAVGRCPGGKWSG